MAEEIDKHLTGNLVEMFIDAYIKKNPGTPRDEALKKIMEQAND